MNTQNLMETESLKIQIDKLSDDLNLANHKVQTLQKDFSYVMKTLEQSLGRPITLTLLTELLANMPKK